MAGSVTLATATEALAEDTPPRHPEVRGRSPSLEGRTGSLEGCTCPAEGRTAGAPGPFIQTDAETDCKRPPLPGQSASPATNWPQNGP